MAHGPHAGLGLRAQTQASVLTDPVTSFCLLSVHPKKNRVRTLLAKLKVRRATMMADCGSRWIKLRYAVSWPDSSPPSAERNHTGKQTNHRSCQHQELGLPDGRVFVNRIRMQGGDFQQTKKQKYRYDMCRKRQQLMLGSQLPPCPRGLLSTIGLLLSLTVWRFSRSDFAGTGFVVRWNFKRPSGGGFFTYDGSTASVCSGLRWRPNCSGFF